MSLERSANQSRAFPEREQRTSRIATALMHSEPACITLLSLEHGPLSGYPLHREFQNNTKSAWESNPKNQDAICHHTLAPACLIEINDEGKFQITATGKRLGMPVAKLLVVKSAEFPFSLRQLFGSSHSQTEHNSVTTRAMILSALSRQDKPVREIDLEGRLGVKRSIIGPHLDKLGALGVVDYQSADFEKPGEFRWTIVNRIDLNTLPTYRERPGLTRQVVEAAAALSSFTSDDVFRLLEETYGGNLANLRTDISGTLGVLEKNGLIRRDPLRSGQVHSQTELTDSGRKIVAEIIHPVFEALESGHIPRKWHELDWLKVAPQVIEKYVRNSGNVRRIPLEQLKTTVLDLICQNPGMRPNAIKDAIGRSPEDILAALVKDGAVRGEKDGKKTHYFPR